MMERLLVLAFMVGAAGSPAAALQRDDPCRSGDDYTACYRVHEAAFLETFGLLSAQSRLAAGDEVRRAMFHGRAVNPIVAVEFRRAPGQEPTVSLYLPRRAGQAMPEPAVSAAVPLAEWERIGEAGRWFDRALAPLPRDSDEETLTLCADGGLYIVETTDSGPLGGPGYVRQRAEQTCDDALATLYAEQMAESAALLIPACRTLDPGRDLLRRLAACAMLQGDRMAAALAHDRLDRLRFAERDEDIVELFDRDAVLDWNGTRSSGSRAAADAWLAGVRGDEPASLFLWRLTGETTERVRVDAVLERWTGGEDEPSRLWRAPVELVLQWSLARQFDIVEARVGAFAELPVRCDPDGLEC